MVTEWNGWEQLIAPYFSECCTSVLGPHLSREGFILLEAAPTEVCWRKGKVFVRLSYWLEDAPKYMTQVEIGLRTLFGQRSMALWHAIPQSVLAANYGSWTFCSEAELCAVLTRLLQDVLLAFAKPLWDDNSKLKRLVDDFESRVVVPTMRRDDLNTMGVLREKALDAFKSGNYRESIRLYKQIPKRQISPAERKRLEIAAKRLSR